ncbi:MAG: hypothetical protein IPJ79_15610 [Bacteroidetes bacterium]|nr:hypothetical protein [Bacteroidota bacterium]
MDELLKGAGAFAIMVFLGYLLLKYISNKDDRMREDEMIMRRTNEGRELLRNSNKMMEDGNYAEAKNLGESNIYCA